MKRTNKMMFLLGTTIVLVVTSIPMQFRSQADGQSSDAWLMFHHDERHTGRDGSISPTSAVTPPATSIPSPIPQPSPTPSAKPAVLRCDTPLTQIELPHEFDTYSGRTSRQNALNFLNQTFGIQTAGALLDFFQSRTKFNELLQPHFLTPESLAGIAERAEFQCTFPDMSHNHRDLLDSSMTRSIYKLGRINPHDDIQIDALLYYLENVAIAKGPPFYDAKTGVVDVPPKRDLVDWVNRARAATPTLRTCEDQAQPGGSEDCLVFQDGTTYDFPPESPPPGSEGGLKLVIPPQCFERSAQDWDGDGVILTTRSASSVLRLNISLINPPPGLRLDLIDLIVSDPYGSGGTYLRRSLNAATQTFFMLSPFAQAYRVRLKAIPVSARLCWSEIPAQPIGVNEKMTNLTLTLDTDDFKYYYYVATCTDNVTILLNWVSGNTSYYVRAPQEPGLNPTTRSGMIEANNRQGPMPPTFPADPNCPNQNPRRYYIALGHFGNPVDTPPCPANPCGTLPSFTLLSQPQASSIQLNLQKQSILKTWYVGRVTQVTWSNDSEPFGLGEGEMNSYASVELTDSQDQKVKTVGVNFPNFVYREAEDYDEPYNNLPTVSSQLPIIGMDRAVLNSFKGYTASFTSYEDDSFILELLNPVTWVRAWNAFSNAIANGIACAGGSAINCVMAVCNLLDGIGTVGNQLAGSEDDPMGTAAGNFVANNKDDGSQFGLIKGTSLQSFTFQASAKKENNVWQNLQKVGDACEQVTAGGYQAAEYLTKLASGKEDDAPWVKVDYEASLMELRPAIKKLEVKFDRVQVIDDREGTGKGDGDMYILTTVGTIGDPGTAPGQTTGNANPLPPDKIKDLPFADVDTLRLPQSDCRGMGDGATWAPGSILFSRTYAPDQYVAGLYVQIVMFDEDNFEDDEVGIVSDWYSFGTLWQFVNFCKQGNDPRFVFNPSTGECKCTLSTKAWTREFLKNKGQDGTWGSEGGNFQYEILIAPP
ncbi:MAG: hypothetical protein HY314_07405 [Acidobacteria bacterium]|nr:hypothetical protein [Acidobacteriota bacterium]